MEDYNLTLLASLAVTSIPCTALAAFIGYLLQKTFGAFLFAVLTLLSFFLLLALALVSPFAMILGMIIIGLLGSLLGKIMFKTKGALIIVTLWSSLCGLFGIGYFLSEIAGVVLITIPAMLLFWFVIFRLMAWHVLPTEGKEQRILAMKSFLTFNLERNYPYYVVEDRIADLRVKGNRFGQAFVGPGIVLTGADHVVLIWDGLNYKGVRPPGLTFTDRFEEIKEVFDLRPQLRSFMVKATTKDGIALDFLAFVPFRISTGEEAPSFNIETEVMPKEKEVVQEEFVFHYSQTIDDSQYPEMTQLPAKKGGPRKKHTITGNPFPYSEDAVIRAARAQMIEYRRQGEGKAQVESRNSKPWHELVPLMADRVLKNIIAQYTFDQLCEPFDPQRDPRTEIRERYLTDLKAAVEPWGVQIVGGGISNLMPADKAILNTRIEHWRTLWAPKIIAQLGKAEAEALSLEAEARALAYKELITRIGSTLAQYQGTSEEYADDHHQGEQRRQATLEKCEEAYKKLGSWAAVLQFIDTIENMMGNEMVRRALPGDVISTLNMLKDAVNQGSKPAESSEKREPLPGLLP